MRILLMTDWNPLSGGSEVYARTLREGFREAGDEVRLLTSGASVEARGIADDVAWASDSAIAKAFLQIGNPFASAKVRDVVRRFRPDVVFVNMFALYLSPSALTALKGTPFVLLVSDYKLICPTGAKLLPDGAICTRPAGDACLEERCLGAAHWLRDQVRYRVMHDAVREASQVLVCSRFLRRALREEGIEGEVEPLPVAAPRTGFTALPDPAPSFLFLGRLDREKGVDTLVEAFARLRSRVGDVTLRIVGRGPLRAKLEALVRELRVADAVTFVGWCEPRDVEAELARAWAIVAPSRWAEPFGLVAVEAMVRGVPAIVSAHGGFAETVEHGVSGLHVPPDDPRALAAAMEEVASGAAFPGHRLDPQIVDRIRRAYDTPGHVRRLRERFERLIASRSRTPAD
jgi:glycosyltransferase involved in cell wall biosynthesis